MSDPVLRLGARGPEVRRLQHLLNMSPGATPIGVDGIFGPATLRSVREAQRRGGLVIDGIVGPATWGALELRRIRGYPWGFPLKRPLVTSPFGFRVHPITKEARHHDGIDFRAAVGTELYAVGNGTVLRIDQDGIGRGQFNGHAVWIRSHGWRFAYLHCSEVLVDVGDVVTRGRVVALAGATGRSTGPHLHFQVWDPVGDLVDPAILWPSVVLETA